MLSAQVGEILRKGRKALELTQRELAKRARVSERLWAEMERGERPNVSLETALRMLSEVGVSVRLNDSMGSSSELRSSKTDRAGRAARAAVRRATWTGRQIDLATEGTQSLSKSRSLVHATRVAEQAVAVSRARKSPSRA